MNLAITSHRSTEKLFIAAKFIFHFIKLDDKIYIVTRMKGH